MNGGYDFAKLKKCTYITSVVFLNMGWENKDWG